MSAALKACIPEIVIRASDRKGLFEDTRNRMGALPAPHLSPGSEEELQGLGDGGGSPLISWRAPPGL